MTKTDERAVVPPVDGTARARLAEAFDAPGVVSALLFGSQATGRASPLSDVDLAVWLDPALSPSERRQHRLALIDLAANVLGTDEVQVVVLNDATPLVRHRALRDGVRLVDRDPRTRIGLERTALLEYLDTAPLRVSLAVGLRHRIEEDRFGRP